MKKLILASLCAAAAFTSLEPRARAASKSLALELHYQERSNWCWAASSQMILRFYDKHFSDQCELAETARNANTGYFGATNCCLQPNGNNDNDGVVGCNRSNSMYGTSESMATLLNLHAVPTTNVTSSLSYALAKTELDASRPFIIRWGWNSGGGHFLVVKGYADASGAVPDQLSLANPLFNSGATMMDYSLVVSNPAANGWSWTHTVKSKAPVGGDNLVSFYPNTSFGGGSWSTNMSIPDLGANSNTFSSAKVRGAPFIFYDLLNYAAPAWGVVPRDYASYTNWGESVDNQVSSLMPVPSASERVALVLFDGQNFTGSSITLTADSPTLPAGWDNHVSSLIVMGKLWQLYSNTNYGGNPYAVSNWGGPNRDGFYPTPAAWGGPDNDASSAQAILVDAFPLLNPIMLFANADLSGRAVVLSKNSPATALNNLANLGFDNTVSSIRTYGDTWTLYENTNQGGTSKQLSPNTWYRTATWTDNTTTSLKYTASNTW